MSSKPDPIPGPRLGAEDLVPAGTSPSTDPAARDVDTDRALRLLARREHELLALSELSQELTISLDLYGLADLVLFNLLGQLGSSRAAVWLISETSPGLPVLLRAHGMSKQMATAVGSTCAGWLLPHLASEKRLVLRAEVESVLDPSATWLLRQEAIALFAPILSRGELLGFLAVGPRVGGASYGPVELQTLQTSLGMVGVALENARLYNRLLENNRQLRVANEHLLELDKLKSEFLRNVNHELRTPLTVVIASLHCLLQEQEPESPKRELLEVAWKKSQSLKGLLETLLQFSEATQNRLHFSFEEGDPTDVLRAYFEERLPGVTQGLREFSFQPAPALPPVRYDRQRLTQIVDVLVDNAVKFTRQGTHITLRTSLGESGGRATMQIDVEDDGPGIPEDRISILFTSFRQVDGSTTREVGGVGLGLAFAKQLAEGMGGRLAVTSHVGQGSKFSLTLPAV